MMRVAHLLDDFAMGGVTRGLSVFAEPELAALAEHRVVPVTGRPLVAPPVDADVIVTHMPPAWDRLAFMRTLKLRNPHARWVHVEHSYTAAWEARTVASLRRFRIMLRLALGGANEIVCVSHAQREWFVGATGLPARTVRPWSGRSELLGLAPRQGALGRPLRLAAIGRFSAQKNFIALSKAVASLPEGIVELHFGGEGPDLARMRHMAAASAHIHFHGRVDQLHEFLDPMDAVIVPSIYEAFGQVALEARLAARPILVADVDGLVEQVGSAGLVADCSSPAKIAEAICRFIAMPLAEMGLAGRAEARGHRDEVVAGWRSVLAPTPQFHPSRDPIPAGRLCPTSS